MPVLEQRGPCIPNCLRILMGAVTHSAGRYPSVRDLYPPHRHRNSAQDTAAAPKTPQKGLCMRGSSLPVGRRTNPWVRLQVRSSTPAQLVIRPQANWCNGRGLWLIESSTKGGLVALATRQLPTLSSVFQRPSLASDGEFRQDLKILEARPTAPSSTSAKMCTMSTFARCPELPKPICTRDYTQQQRESAITHSRQPADLAPACH